MVWIPKYGKRVLRGKIARRIKELFYQCAQIHNWNIEELKIRVYHIHMLVQISPEVTLSKVVQYFKGGSSNIIRKENPELEEFLWGDSFWVDGYFAETVGSTQDEIIKKYIREQKNSSMPQR